MNDDAQLEIDSSAKELVELREQLSSSQDKSLQRQYKKLERSFVTKSSYLVKRRVSKYKKFNNFQDLEQDGFEALMKALVTYRPEKGSFTWWADKYISTRIARAANAHSTVKISMKQCQKFTPFKISLDDRGAAKVSDHNNDNSSFLEEKLQESDFYSGRNNSKDSLTEMESREVSRAVLTAVQRLPDPRAIRAVYGLDQESASIAETAKMLGLKKSQCLKLLRESKEIIKNEMKNF